MVEGDGGFKKKFDPGFEKGLLEDKYLENGSAVLVEDDTRLIDEETARWRGGNTASSVGGSVHRRPGSRVWPS